MYRKPFPEQKPGVMLIRLKYYCTMRECAALRILSPKKVFSNYLFTVEVNCLQFAGDNLIHSLFYSVIAGIL